MRLRWIIQELLLTSVVILTHSLVVFSQQTSSTILRNTLESSRFLGSGFYVDGEHVYNEQYLIQFYEATSFELAWENPENVSAMMVAVTESYNEGLNPAEYHAAALQTYFQHEQSEQDKAYFDILLTDTFLEYGSHLLSGKCDPEVIYPGKWKSEKRNLDLVMLLRDALQTSSIAATLEGLKPDYPEYEELKTHLKMFRKIQAKDWPYIPEGITLTNGAVDKRIPLIRKRLLMTDSDLSRHSKDSLLYDSLLMQAVMKFQFQHGLKDDGVIGTSTLHALNYSPDVYIQKILVNLERYRWLPWNLGEKYVAVNIPAFSLKVVDRDSLILSMKTIVGRPDRSTPVFSSEIRYVVLNPTWTVPPTILKEDVLPAVKRNRHYLVHHNLRVINRAGEEIDPSGLPWHLYTEKNFPYQIRQDPGLYNSMGLIKFQFPNHQKIFLHDTNMRSLFSETYRALSSGCIRIEHPFKLAACLLENTRWTASKLQRIIASGHTQTILISKPARIHLHYFTAFITEGNILQIREDIYRLDQPIAEELTGLVIEL